MLTALFLILAVCRIIIGTGREILKCGCAFNRNKLQQLAIQSSSMPLTAELQARLAKRGLIGKTGSTDTSK